MGLLTKKSEKHHTSERSQAILYCDCCQEPVSVSVKPFATLEQTEEALIVAAKDALRHCPVCLLWVCRNDCWNAIAAQCETCSGNTMPAKKTTVEGMADNRFSSILGDVKQLKAKPEKKKP